MTAKVLTAAVILLTAAGAHAQSAKVIKVQGRKAIVQTAPGTELRVGQTVSVGGNEPSFDSSTSMSSSSAKGSVSGSRENSIAGQFEFKSLTSSSSKGGSSSSTESVFELTGQYGWNRGIMEFGPRAGIANSNSTGNTVNVLFVGGFFDYNLVPNAPGTLFVYGVGGTADVGTISTSGSSGTMFELFAGGNCKWFPFNNTAAVRADLGLDYGSFSSSGTTTTKTGIVARAAFAIYL